MRVFRTAIPPSQIDRSREFYEVVLGVEADVTVPSRVYFHCGAVIVAVIDWAVEPLGPFRSTPENLYFATDGLDAAHQRAKHARARQPSKIERRLDPQGMACRLQVGGHEVAHVAQTHETDPHRHS